MTNPMLAELDEVVRLSDAARVNRPLISRPEWCDFLTTGVQYAHTTLKWSPAWQSHAGTS